MIEREIEISYSKGFVFEEVGFFVVVENIFSEVLEYMENVRNCFVFVENIC